MTYSRDMFNRDALAGQQQLACLPHTVLPGEPALQQAGCLASKPHNCVYSTSCTVTTLTSHLAQAAAFGPAFPVDVCSGMQCRRLN
jgi:hypothetical protein